LEDLILFQVGISWNLAVQTVRLMTDPVLWFGLCLEPKLALDSVFGLILEAIET
jgi:hypothetical protein